MGKTSNVFETALRTNLRFATIKGQISLEDLWAVPLRSKDGFDLNAIAKTANALVKAATEENFVDAAKHTPEQAKQEMRLDIVKYIIQTKVVEEEEAATRAANAVKRKTLLEALAEKQAGALSEMSEKELRKQIEALGDG